MTTSSAGSSPEVETAAHTASSLLVMMIMGGGVISLLQGWLAGDGLLGIRLSYLTGVFCFAYLAFFAWRVGRLHKEHGVGLEAAQADPEDPA